MSEQKRVASVFDLVRMCKSFIKIGCKGCPLDGRGGVPCPEFDFTEKDNEAIVAWCDEHPQKTYAQYFFEKFPKAKRYREKSGKEYPDEVCRALIFGKQKEDIGCLIKSCSYCWNEVLPEEVLGDEQDDDVSCDSCKYFCTNVYEDPCRFCKLNFIQGTKEYDAHKLKWEKAGDIKRNDR